MPVVQLVGAIRDETDYSSESWAIGLLTGAIFGLAVAIGLYWSWRRRGGQQLLRIAARALRTDVLPSPLPVRIALLHEYERRERSADKNARMVLFGAIWTVILALRIVADHSLFNVIAALLIWGLFGGMTVVDVLDRRRRPRRQALIARLRERPYVPAPGDGVTNAAEPS